MQNFYVGHRVELGVGKVGTKHEEGVTLLHGAIGRRHADEAVEPHEIGVLVQAADRNRQVVTLSGDGGLSMLMGDMLTLRQLELNIKIVVFNNGALGFVEQEMKAAGIETYGTAFRNQNFADIANAAGIRGWRADTPEQVKPALNEAFAHPGPALIDVAVARQELSLPPTIRLAQAAGFNLYMVKAMIHGDGNEVLDMAKTNLWR